MLSELNPGFYVSAFISQYITDHCYDFISSRPKQWNGKKVIQIPALGGSCRGVSQNKEHLYAKKLFVSWRSNIIIEHHFHKQQLESILPSVTQLCHHTETATTADQTPLTVEGSCQGRVEVKRLSSHIAAVYYSHSSTLQGEIQPSLKLCL